MCWIPNSAAWHFLRNILRRSNDFSIIRRRSAMIRLSVLDENEIEAIHQCQPAHPGRNRCGADRAKKPRTPDRCGRQSSGEACPASRPNWWRSALPWPGRGQPSGDGAGRSRHLVTGNCISTTWAVHHRFTMLLPGHAAWLPSRMSGMPPVCWMRLENCHTITPFFTPTEVPGGVMSLAMYRHALPYTVKPLARTGRPVRC